MLSYISARSKYSCTNTAKPKPTDTHTRLRAADVQRGRSGRPAGVGAARDRRGKGGERETARGRGPLADYVAGI